MQAVKIAPDGARPVLLIVQPLLATYRLPVFSEMAAHWEVYLASSPADGGAGFGEPSIEGTSIRSHRLFRETRLLGGRVIAQAGVPGYVWSLRPGKVLHFANPRSLSYWMTAVLCRLRGIEFYSHGQGLYDKPGPSRWRKRLYQAMVGLSTRYICYTESAADSLRDAGIRGDIAVAANSLVNQHSVPPGEKTGRESGVLFLGRLREGCKLDLLIDALTCARVQLGKPLILHVIGSGECAQGFLDQYRNLEWINWHGQIYDQKAVREISLDCAVGCYPGDAGLSVVHYMSLSLVPVIHNSPPDHMGPEPSYVIDHVNGRLFDRQNALLSLTRVLVDLFRDDSGRAALQAAAYRFYSQLIDPSLATRLLRAMGKS